MPQVFPFLSFALSPLLLIFGLSACNHGPDRSESDTLSYALLESNELALPGAPVMNDPDQIARLQDEPDEIDDFDDDDLFALPQVPDITVWSRIREGFSLEPHLDRNWIKMEMDWYRRHPEYLHRVMVRSEPFIHYILDEIEKRGLPTELVLLPVVESAYQPFAYSHGRAAGIWQFIPSTGRLYGLKQDWWYDGRRDIMASTEAALNYLVNLNKLFDGNWLHALAAYNSGSGTVQRAIRNNKKRNRPTDFWHLKLPRETRAYVPKLLALRELINNPEQYDISLRCIPRAPGFAVVETGGQIDLALAAELAGIDVETLYQYNPGFNRWATPPDGPHTLLLPAEAAQQFNANITGVPDTKRVSWTRHRIRNGETLSHIASKYHTTVRQLRQVNNLRGSTIRAGQHLLIPVASRSRSAYALSAGERKKAIQNAPRGSKKVNHIVQRGESFWEISRRYGVSMHKLAKWNGMAVRDPLREGQRLVVWMNNPVSGVTMNNLKPSHTIQPISYIVRIGDSLSRIASRFNVTIADLHRWNTITGKYLQPGQRLKLFIDITEQAG